MKRWMGILGNPFADDRKVAYVAADTEAYARERLTEALGAPPDDVSEVGWPDRRTWGYWGVNGFDAYANRPKRR